MEGSPPTVIGGCAIWEALGAGAAVGEAAADKVNQARSDH